MHHEVSPLPPKTDIRRQFRSISVTKASPLIRASSTQCALTGWRLNRAKSSSNLTTREEGTKGNDVLSSGNGRGAHLPAAKVASPDVAVPSRWHTQLETRSEPAWVILTKRPLGFALGVWVHRVGGCGAGVPLVSGAHATVAFVATALTLVRACPAPCKGQHASAVWRKNRAQTWLSPTPTLTLPPTRFRTALARHPSDESWECAACVNSPPDSPSSASQLWCSSGLGTNTRSR